MPKTLPSKSQVCKFCKIANCNCMSQALEPDNCELCKCEYCQCYLMVYGKTNGFMEHDLDPISGACKRCKLELPGNQLCGGDVRADDDMDDTAAAGSEESEELGGEANDGMAELGNGVREEWQEDASDGTALYDWHQRGLFAKKTAAQPEAIPDRHIPPRAPSSADVELYNIRTCGRLTLWPGATAEVMTNIIIPTWNIDCVTAITSEAPTDSNAGYWIKTGSLHPKFSGRLHIKIFNPTGKIQEIQKGCVIGAVKRTDYI